MTEHDQSILESAVCNLDRAIPEMINGAGFTIATMKGGYVGGLPKFAGEVYRDE